LLGLINGVLDLSKIEAGRMESRPEPVSLPGVVREVTGILSPLAGEKSIRIETSLDPELEEVTTDPSHLKQVVYNYLSNAIKFTDIGGLVSVTTQREGQKEFRLAVTDTGIGISPAGIEKLFVEFQQLDGGDAKRHSGTGLGLALTKRIVEAGGGRVGVRSEPGKGSTFYAVLPRMATQAERFTALASVLVIEDEKSQGRVLRRALEKAGYRVDTASSCHEAITKCRAQKFDAITLDILLPDGQGLHLVEPIRETVNSTTPIIVVSALAEEDIKSPAKVQCYLRKPVDLTYLLQVLRENGVPGLKKEGNETTVDSCRR
jgi:CheY-like chemotaxis protein